MKLPDFDDFMDRTMAVLLLLGIVLLLVRIYTFVFPPAMPNAIDLSAFKCTDMRAETNTIMMPSGKTLVPMTITENVCYQWTAK